MAEELTTFLKVYGIREVGNINTAAKRGKKVVDIIQTTSEVICPDLDTSQK